MNTKPLSSDQPGRYCLQMQGHLVSDWADWMPDADLRFENNRTILTGTVRDQAALFGLISHIRDLGAVLLLVKYISDSNDY